MPDTGFVDVPEPEEPEDEPLQEWRCWMCGATGSEPCQTNRPWECPYA